MVLLLISVNRVGFPGCAGRRKGERRLQLPISSVLCGWCLSSSSDSGVGMWLRGSSLHAVLALYFLPKESFHDFV